MVDLEGQDHGPSSSSVGDNDDDFIVYSKEGNNARWFKKEGDEVSAEDILCEVETDNARVAMECTEEVFLAKIIHGDGAKVIKVGEVPLSKIKGTGSDGTIVQADNEDYLGCKANSIHYKKLQAESGYWSMILEALSLCQIWEELMGSSNSVPSSIPHNLEYLPSDQRVVPGADPDQYTFASYMSVTLSCDHRVIDGA
ncbi:hypothetical protein Sjap_017919 [Stephania japonica]|uniref:Lipoyl-binding domain-containing protein n=1 Tax=Stephania japonica TaxID=461633 RepID=A0AAP0I727_9MAGN